MYFVLTATQPTAHNEHLKELIDLYSSQIEVVVDYFSPSWFITFLI